MTEIEKQEGQKTVVAFIAGLLIGGLLVWVFSASPESEVTETDSDNETTTEQTTSTDTEDDTPASENGGSDKGGDETPTNGNEPSQTTGEGDISVSDQGAGSVVVLDSVTFPTNNGWVVVRDYVDGTPGNILGAARYSLEVGLEPSSVNLLRSTEAGSTYQIVFYSENGDRVFDLDDDVEIQGYSATFTAE